jgi:hypothetical protein
VPASLGCLLLACAVLAGCGSPGPVPVDAPELTGSAARQCSALVDALPATVAGERRRDVTPANGSAAAWGDDQPIVLRCGLRKPRALEPTSFCLIVNRVGWLATSDGVEVPLDRPPSGELDFTTIGRSVYVELAVPGDYQPPSDALVDVSSAIKATTDDVQPCQ